MLHMPFKIVQFLHAGSVDPNLLIPDPDPELINSDPDPGSMTKMI